MKLSYKNIRRNLKKLMKVRATNNKLLQRLIKDEEPFPAPPETERFGEWYEFVIGIGNDHCAFITMTKEAYEVLKKEVS